MSNLNLLIHLKGYQDATSTNNPRLNHFAWERDLQGLSINEPESKCITLAAGQALSLFSGLVSTSEDATTVWDLTLKSGSSTVYRLAHAGGTLPVFRTSRLSGGDATTQVTVTKNATLLTYTSTAGTLFSLIANSVVVGDEVRIGTGFNLANQGKFKILAVTATSFTIENNGGQAEGPITLGATFADEINIFSADGVQINDKLDILAGFSSVTFGTYDITDVSHNYIEFVSLNTLPLESGIVNSPDSFLIYRDAKQFLFIESDKKLDISLNGSLTNELIPMNAGTSKKQGFFLSSSSMKSASITNKDVSPATIFYAVAE